MNIEDIIDAIRHNRIRITDHADEEAISDDITFEEIFISVECGDIIEDYPLDTPYPSCLIFGSAFGDAPIHSVWAYNENNKWAVLVTTYRPAPERWIEWRIRRLK